jgi:hypothetical protein
MNVFKRFFGSNYTWNKDTKCTEIDFSLIHKNMIIGLYKYYDICFEINIVQDKEYYESNFKIRANMYQIKEFDGTDKYYSGYPSDKNILFDNSWFRRFLSCNISTYDIETDKLLNIYFNHPIQLLYLSNISKDKVKNIVLIFDGLTFLDISGDELNDDLTIVFNSDLFNKSNKTINFSRIYTATIMVKTFDNECIKCNVNAIYNNLLGVNTGKIMMNFFSN